MKRMYILFTALFLSTSMFFAQNKPNECDINLSLEHDYTKSGKYQEALSSWEKVYKECPDKNEAVYADGTRIFKYFYKKAVKTKNQAKVTEYQNKLFELYDNWIKYFPKTKYIGKIYQDKGLLMFDSKTPKDKLYEVFNIGFTKGKTMFTNPKALYAYFDAAVDMHKNNKLGFENMIKTYDNVQEAIGKSIDKYTLIMEKLQKKEDAGELLKSEERKLKAIKRNIPIYSIVSKNMDKILGKLGDCTHLVPLYQRKFDENKNNPSWLRKAARNLSNKNCSNDPIFAKLVTQLDNIEPSFSSAFYLGILNEKKGKISTAESYYKKSINLTQDNYKKAKVYYRLAVLAKKRSAKSQARSYANKALQFKPSMGNAYLLIAGLYASSVNSCGKDKFEKRATYWLAAKMADRAAVVDPSIAKEARRRAANYRKLAPSKEMIFMSNMAGKTIKFNCWIGKNITVPNVN